MRGRAWQLQSADGLAAEIPTPSPRSTTKRPVTFPIATWETKYRAVVIAGDLFCTVAVALGMVAAIWVFGIFSRPPVGYPMLILPLLTCTLTIGSLLGHRAWASTVLGQGAEEFHRLGRALITAAVLIATVGIGLDATGFRCWVFGAIPAIALLTFPVRYLLRQLLHRRRQSGRCLLPVLVAGSMHTAADLIERTRRAPHNGWRVEAVCTDSLDAGQIHGVPVVGGLEKLADQVCQGGYRVVAVTPDPYWTPGRLQRLAWQLEGTPTEMVVAPMLMEVAGPRVHVTGVLGLPLLRVAAPTFSGARRVIKEIIDRTVALLLLLILAPIFMVISALIVLFDGKAVFYRQRRIGKGGKPFTIIKFRTMVVDADHRRADLLSSNEASGPLFKLRRDPRITPVGSVLRRFSLDELPQLINVLGGTMSLVGPRPPLPEEVADYEPDVRRRLLVKPGMTGLWQVSGRSNLGWEESVRLDLRYVEDWSLALDALILWKTARAVLRGQGAY